MRKVFYLFLIVHSFSNVFCQSDNDFLRARVGYGFCGSGDMSGKIIGISYLRSISNSIEIAPNFNYSGYKQIIQTNSTIAAYILSGGFTVLIHTNRNRKVLFHTGLGANINQFKWDMKTGSNSLEIKGIRLGPYSQKYFKEKIGFGLEFVSGFSLNLRSFYPGLFYYFQNDTNANIIHSFQLGVTFEI